MEITGYFGPVGILPTGGDKYIWHPISEATRLYVQCKINKDYLVIPCMDNTLIYMKTDNIDDLLFVDEACDRPYNLDWDEDISEAVFPAVVYEAFSEYYSDYIIEGIKPDITEVS